MGDVRSLARKAAMGLTLAIMVVGLLVLVVGVPGLLLAVLAGDS